ncbi:hypothetical protein [Methanococcoides vulcani]|uniref:hypothetical protein n=1 Tax=Methanococcoides vulcani TaxID=1353158 RepID=UPI00108475A4|nr:hypothetical protein [Methanococcoides vulcani]
MSVVDDILNDYKIEDWFDTQEYSESTRTRYLYCICKYIDFTKKSPEELIREAEDDIRNGLLPRERKIKQYMIRYRKSLVNAGYAPKTIGI